MNPDSTQYIGHFPREESATGCIKTLVSTSVLARVLQEESETTLHTTHIMLSRRCMRTKLVNYFTAPTKI